MNFKEWENKTYVTYRVWRLGMIIMSLDIIYALYHFSIGATPLGFCWLGMFVANLLYYTAGKETRLGTSLRAQHGKLIASIFELVFGLVIITRSLSFWILVNSL